MLLNSVLKANACFSLICGVMLVAMPSSVAGFLGEVPNLLLVVLGVGLIVFAIDVFVVSGKLPSNLAQAQRIMWADATWVALTPIVLWVFSERLTSTGMMILIDLAIVIGIFTVLEWRGIRLLSAATSRA